MYSEYIISCGKGELLVDEIKVANQLILGRLSQMIQVHLKSSQRSLDMKDGGQTQNKNDA